MDDTANFCGGYICWMVGSENGPKIQNWHCPFKQSFKNFVVFKIDIFIHIFVSGEIKLQLEGGVDAGKDEFI